MRVRFGVALSAGMLMTAAALGAPPVTSAEVPSPSVELSRRWMNAVFQAASPPKATDTAALRMLRDVLADQPLGPGVGWFGPSNRRYDWNWLQQHFDSDGNNHISRSELGRSELFRRLDRDQNGEIEAGDLDWSEASPWVRQEAQALKLLRLMDRNGDGQLSEAEWLAYYKKIAGEKGFVSSSDLRAPFSTEQRGRKKNASSKTTWIQCLTAGDLGSVFDGPDVGQPAPDFTLPMHHGGGQITLSQFQRNKPVVLIFGSFT